LKRAIAYHAYGKSRYVEMATISAESAKKKMPDVEIILLTEMDVGKNAFDRIIHVPGIARELVNFAPLLSIPAEYESIVYFDCDTYVCAHFYDVFELVESQNVDVALVPVRHRTGMPTGDWDERVPKLWPEMRGTPMAYMNNARMRDFIQQWFELFREQQRKYHAISVWAGQRNFPRQPSLRIALYHSNLKVASLPPKFYLVGSRIIQGTVRAFHTNQIVDRAFLKQKARAINRNAEELRFITDGKAYLFGDLLGRK